MRILMVSTNKPIGVATHRLGRELPAGLQGTLPTVQKLEQQLERAQLPESNERGGQG